VVADPELNIEPFLDFQVTVLGERIAKPADFAGYFFKEVNPPLFRIIFIGLLLDRSVR
jgi:hypothetical protein